MPTKAELQALKETTKKDEARKEIAKIVTTISDAVISAAKLSTKDRLTLHLYDMDPNARPADVVGTLAMNSSYIKSGPSLTIKLDYIDPILEGLRENFPDSRIAFGKVYSKYGAEPVEAEGISDADLESIKKGHYWEAKGFTVDWS
jgi:hypothetical protein